MNEARKRADVPIVNRLLVWGVGVLGSITLLFVTAIVFLEWREGSYPWTDRSGGHWATLHVQNDSDRAIEFQRMAPTVSDLDRGEGQARYAVMPRSRRDFGVITIGHGSPIKDDEVDAAREVACMVHLADDERIVFPVVLVPGDHLRVRVRDDGRVAISRGDESLVGWVSFGDEQVVEHAPPSSEAWRSLD